MPPAGIGMIILIGRGVTVIWHFHLNPLFPSCDSCSQVVMEIQQCLITRRILTQHSRWHQGTTWKLPETTKTIQNIKCDQRIFHLFQLRRHSVVDNSTTLWRWHSWLGGRWSELTPGWSRRWSESTMKKMIVADHRDYQNQQWKHWLWIVWSSWPSNHLELTESVGGRDPTILLLACFLRNYQFKFLYLNFAFPGKGPRGWIVSSWLQDSTWSMSIW